MVGEIHGTKEPAQFVTGLAELLAKHGDSVQVGFEIPSELMTLFLQNPSDSNVFHSDFFIRGFDDGRSSIAMASAIARLSRNPKIEVFFYDLNTGDTYAQRDSIMYRNIKRQMLKHKNRKTITLSGNIHNMILPHRTGKKMGFYLMNDEELNLQAKLCSLNQSYYSGTARNNTGNGLELQTLGNTKTSTKTNDTYLLLYGNNNTIPYTGVYHTNQVTAAEMVKN